MGAQQLLDEPITAFFASRQCPGAATGAAMDWALAQVKGGGVVARGCHSPLEQSVLTVLLQARSPVVVVLARPVLDAKLPSAWVEPLAQGRIAVVSAAISVARWTSEAATLRNSQAVELTKRLL